jgi:PAS domain S-box-containing protein
MKDKTAQTASERKRSRRPGKGPVMGSPAARGESPSATVAARGTSPNFELLFFQNPLPMYILDRESMKFLEVNDAAIQKYGYTRVEFLRMNATDIRPSEDVPRFLKAVHEVSDTLVAHGLWRHIKKSGEVLDVEVTTQGIPFGRRKALLAVAQDVTSLRHAEQQAAEQGVYLQALLLNLPLAVVILDSQSRIRICNPAFERLFGYDPAEVVGRLPQSFLAPPGHASELEQVTARVMAGETIRTQTKRQRRNGQLLDLEMLAIPLILEGRIIGSVRVYEDLSERATAAHAQREAEEKFQSLFENAVEGIFQSTVDGKYLTVNPALARMYGYASPAELIARVHNIGHTLYVLPKRREEFRRIIEGAGVVEAFESEVFKKDGTKIWISENARAVVDASGKIASYEGTVEDITDRKRSESERQVITEIVHAVSLTDNLEDLLRRVHSALQSVLSAENCFVALYEPSTGVFNFPFFADRTQPTPPPQMVWRSCAAYVYRAGRPMLIPPQLFYELVEQEEVESSAKPPASWLGVPLRATAGTIGVLVVQNYERQNAYSQRDLEFLSSVGDQIAFAIERKRAEGRIRESEARLRVLIEQLPAVLWTVDKDLRFTSALGAGLARLGLRPNQIVGLSLQDYFETSDPTFVPFAAHRRAVAGEPVTFHVEWKNGSYACHVEPLRGADGTVLGAICMALDITDRKELEERFRQSQKMEAVGRLAGGIAHDFNNLLMVIQGYADLLAERLPGGDPLRRSAEQIQMASQRAASLTQQLLAFSRKQILAPKVLNVHTVVADMEKILRRLIGEDIQLETNTQKDLGLVKADRSQIEQVILNLAVNARDAMPGGGRITIETANVELDASFTRVPQVLAPGRYVMLAVTDSGTGMDAETQAHIFEPFFTTKEKGKGTGLGLATVYGIVKQSGGYVWVYSEPGHGATFKIYLPRIEEEGSGCAAREPSETRSLPRGSSELVLLVEDEKGVRELAREYLETSGYRVIEAQDGHTALELAAAHAGSIDVLFTDVVMPGIGGRELAERVAQIRPGIKILYMTGYTDRAIVHHGILETDAVLLQKPFTLGTLAAKLREILTAETVH